MAKESAELPPIIPSVLVVLATAAAGLGAFGFFVRGGTPFQGWIALGVAFAVAWYELRVLPGLRERHALSQARQEAKRLAKAVRSAARKQKNWVGGEERDHLVALCDAAMSAVTSGDAAAIEAATRKLDDAADRVLRRKPIYREYIEQIGGALLAAAFIRLFLYEAYRIPSGSMVPTLLVGDHLFVNKFVYGIRVPFSLTKFFIRVPKRGDIVVFNRPPSGEGDDIIKRVIGLPGDRIEVRDRHVSVNGVPFPSKTLPALTLPDCDVQGNDEGESCIQSRNDRFLSFEETVGTHEHVALEREDAMPDCEYEEREGTWTVLPDHVFVMGDNRDNSLDSRFDAKCHGFSQVPLNFIKGRADIIWLSLGGPYGVRFSRMFSLIH